MASYKIASANSPNQFSGLSLHTDMNTRCIGFYVHVFVILFNMECHGHQDSC